MFKTLSNTIPQGIKITKEQFRKNGVHAVQGTLEVIRSHVVPKTPVVTGRLKGSISGEYGVANKKGDMVFLVEEKANSIIGKVGSNVEYAAKVEFTSKKNKFFFYRGFVECITVAKTVLINILKF